jgi:hypothetical protein
VKLVKCTAQGGGFRVSGFGVGFWQAGFVAAGVGRWCRCPCTALQLRVCFVAPCIGI